jgi:hypothetical protein
MLVLRGSVTNVGLLQNVQKDRILVTYISMTVSSALNFLTRGGYRRLL